MAASGRVRHLAVLRLAGATRRQVLRLAAAEALTAVAVGALLGLLVTVVNLAGMWGALALLSVRPAVTLPWQALGTTTGACALLAVAAATAPPPSPCATARRTWPGSASSPSGPGRSHHETNRGRPPTVGP
ncbi:FtsX-like permease family protein [Streptomyces sp. NPDC057424]|uniref:FtsX-like permease family protein n=1 Tax=Streptomyces sp. NPDC057424 TaxID=3346127 RepID=UPI0036747C1C